MSQETIYDFQWDPAKALSNSRKHNVTFDQAATVFLDALAHPLALRTVRATRYIGVTIARS